MVRKGDPQVVRWALKKCLLLEKDPEAGVELRGALIGYRKIVVGNRDWRMVWRVTHDDSGKVIVDVAEVWAVGARSDSEVYDEVTQRVADLRGQSHTVPLADALAALGRLTHGLEATPEPSGDDVQDLPAWLTDVLTKVVGMPADEVALLSETQARAAWDAYTTGTR